MLQLDDHCLAARERQNQSSTQLLGRACGHRHGDLEAGVPVSLLVHQRWASASLPDFEVRQIPFLQFKRVGTRQSMSSWWTFQYSMAGAGSCRSSPLAPLAQWLPALSVKLIITITRDMAGDPPSLTSTIAPPLLGTLMVHRPGGSTPIMTRYSGS
jgi:hypothetical protein